MPGRTVAPGDPFRREEGRLGPRETRHASVRDVRSRPHGEAEGTFTLTGDAHVTADARIRAKAEVDTGGTVTVTSTAGLVRVSGLVDTRGHNGGDVQVSGGAVQVDSRRIDTRPGGRQTYAATAGDLTLTGGSFVARNGGTTEGTAPGNLTAAGSFQVGQSGCIALAAGGTLDTMGATFDAPVAPSCP